jgi:hypothetical protein
MNAAQNAEIIGNFIDFNEEILNEIKTENPELSGALSKVIKEIFSKFVGIEIPKEETEKPEEKPLEELSERQFQIGDLVATLSEQWSDGAQIIGFPYEKSSKKVGVKQKEYKYVVRQGVNEYVEEEDNLFLFIPQNTVTEYSSMTLEQLQEELEAMREIIDIFNDPTEPEQIKAEDAIIEIELEIERKK